MSDLGFKEVDERDYSASAVPLVGGLPESTDIFGNVISHAPEMMDTSAGYLLGAQMVGGTLEGADRSAVSGQRDRAKPLYGDELITHIKPIDATIRAVETGIKAVEGIADRNKPLIDKTVGTAGRRLTAATLDIAQQGREGLAEWGSRVWPHINSQIDSQVERTVAATGKKAQQLLKNKVVKQIVDTTVKTVQSAADKTQRATESFIEALHGASYTGILPEQQALPASPAADAFFKADAGTGTLPDDATLTGVEALEEALEEPLEEPLTQPVEKSAVRSTELPEESQHEVAKTVPDSSEAPSEEATEISPEQKTTNKIEEVHETHQRLERENDELEQSQRHLNEKLEVAEGQQAKERSRIDDMERELARLEESSRELSSAYQDAKAMHDKRAHQLRSLTVQSLINEQIDQAESSEEREALRELRQLNLDSVADAKRQIETYESLASIPISERLLDFAMSKPSFLRVVLHNVQRNYEQKIARFELYVTLIDTAIKAYERRKDELTVVAELHRGALEESITNVRQNKADYDELAGRISEAKSSQDEIDATVDDLVAQLSEVLQSQEATQQSIQDLLDAYGYVLPEAEVLEAIADRKAYVQEQLAVETEDEKVADLTRQMTWLEVQSAQLIDDTDTTQEAVRDSLIASLTNRYEEMSAAGHRETAKALRMYIAVLELDGLDEAYLSNNVGLLGMQLSSLKQAKRAVVNEIDRLLARSSETSDAAEAATESESPSPQVLLDIQLLQRVEAALDYELGRTENQRALLEYIFPEGERFRLERLPERGREKIRAALFEMSEHKFSGSNALTDKDKSLMATVLSVIDQWKVFVTDDDLLHRFHQLIDLGLPMMSGASGFFESRVLPEVSHFIEHLGALEKVLSDSDAFLSGATRNPALGVFRKFFVGQLEVIAEIKAQVTEMRDELLIALEEAQVSWAHFENKQAIEQRAQQQIDNQLQAWEDRAQAIKSRAQAGPEDAKGLHKELEGLLKELINDSVEGLESAHLKGNQLLHLREEQSRLFEELVKDITGGLQSSYAERRYDLADLKNSITIFSTLRLAYDSLLENLQAFEHEMERLQLDAMQGEALQDKLAEIQSRYGEAVETIEATASDLLDEIADKAGAAVEKFSGEGAAIEDLERQAEGAFRQAQQIEDEAREVKQRGIDARIETLRELGDSRTRAFWIDEEDIDAATLEPRWNENWSEGDPYWKPVIKLNRGRISGKKTFDQAWNIWRQLKGNAQALRAQAEEFQARADRKRESQAYRFEESLKTQWSAVLKIGEGMKASLKEIKRLLAVDVAGEQQKGEAAEALLGLMREDLPLLIERVDQAAQEMQTAHDNLEADWTDYEASAEAHHNAVLGVLSPYGEWDNGLLNYRGEIDEIEAWVNQQQDALNRKVEQVNELRQALGDRLSEIETQLPDATKQARRALKSEKRYLRKSLNLIEDVQAVFENQQASLNNLAQLEGAHEMISVSEQRLAEDYIKNPDLDGEVLAQQSAAPQQALLEPQRLAAQAEESSRLIDLATGRYLNHIGDLNAADLAVDQSIRPVLVAFQAAVEQATESASDVKQAQARLIAIDKKLVDFLKKAEAAGDVEARAWLRMSTEERFAEIAQANARDVEDRIIRTKKRYRPLLDEYVEVAEARLEEKYSDEERWAIYSKISGDVHYAVEYGSKDAQKRVDEIAKKGPLEQYLVRLYTLQLRIKKALREDYKSSDLEAKNLLGDIRRGYIPDAKSKDIDRWERAHAGTLNAAKRMREYHIPKDLQNADEKRKRQLMPILEELHAENAHYQQLARQAEADAHNAFDVRLEIEDEIGELEDRRDEIQREVDTLNEQLKTDLENVDSIRQSLDALRKEQAVIVDMLNRTQVALKHLIEVQEVNLSQAQLTNVIASQRSEGLQQLINNELAQNSLEKTHEELLATAELLALSQNEAELQVQAAMNEANEALSLAPVNAIKGVANRQEQAGFLFQKLEQLAAEPGELSDGLQAAIEIAQTDLNDAMRGESAVRIHASLTTLFDELSLQHQQFTTEGAALKKANQLDLEILGLVESESESEADKRGKLHDLEALLGKIADNDAELAALGHDKRAGYIDLAFAKQRVKFAKENLEQSELLDAQLHSVISGMITERIEYRRTAGSRLWNKIKIGLTTALSVVSVALTFGSASPLAVALISLTVASIATVDGAVRGDWVDFAGGLASFAGGVTNLLGTVGTVAVDTAQHVNHAITASKTVSRTAQAFAAGDNWLGGLSAAAGSLSLMDVGGLTDAVNDISDPISRGVISGVLTTAQHVPQKLYSGISAIENGDWLGGVSGLFDTAVGISDGLMLSVGHVLSADMVADDALAAQYKSALDGLGMANKVGHTGISLTRLAKDGQLVDLVAIAKIWQKDIQQQIKEKQKQENPIAQQANEHPAKQQASSAEAEKLGEEKVKQPKHASDKPSENSQSEAQNGAEGNGETTLDELEDDWDSDDPLAGIDPKTGEAEPLLIVPETRNQPGHNRQRSRAARLSQNRHQPQEAGSPLISPEEESAGMSFGPGAEAYSRPTNGADAESTQYPTTPEEESMGASIPGGYSSAPGERAYSSAPAEPLQNEDKKAKRADAVESAQGKIPEPEGHFDIGKLDGNQVGIRAEISESHESEDFFPNSPYFLKVDAEKNGAHFVNSVSSPQYKHLDQNVQATGHLELTFIEAGISAGKVDPEAKNDWHVRGGAGIAVGMDMRLYAVDEDNDGVTEFGARFDVGFASIELRQEVESFESLIPDYFKIVPPSGVGTESYEEWLKSHKD